MSEFVLTPWQEQIVEEIVRAIREDRPLFLLWPRQAGRTVVAREVRKRLGRGASVDRVIVDEAVDWRPS